MAPGTIEKTRERIDHGVQNSPLPPSVEAAYYRKCIDLKRRVDEIEANNDRHRLNIERHQQAIRKLRLERAMILEMIEREMSGKDVKEDRRREDNSDGSDAGDETEEESVPKRKTLDSTPKGSGLGARKRKAPGSAKGTHSSPDGHKASLGASVHISEAVPYSPNGPGPSAYANGDGTPRPKEEEDDNEAEDVAMGGAPVDGFTAVNTSNAAGGRSASENSLLHPANPSLS